MANDKKVLEMFLPFLKIPQIRKNPHKKENGKNMKEKFSNQFMTECKRKSLEVMKSCKKDFFIAVEYHKFFLLSDINDFLYSYFAEQKNMLLLVKQDSCVIHQPNIIMHINKHNRETSELMRG